MNRLLNCVADMLAVVNRIIPQQAVRVALGHDFDNVVKPPADDFKCDAPSCCCQDDDRYLADTLWCDIHAEFFVKCEGLHQQPPLTNHELAAVRNLLRYKVNL